MKIVKLILGIQFFTVLLFVGAMIHFIGFAGDASQYYTDKQAREKKAFFDSCLTENKHYECVVKWNRN